MRSSVRSHLAGPSPGFDNFIRSLVRFIKGCFIVGFLLFILIGIVALIMKYLSVVVFIVGIPLLLIGAAVLLYRTYESI